MLNITSRSLRKSAVVHATRSLEAFEIAHETPTCVIELLIGSSSWPPLLLGAAGAKIGQSAACGVHAAVPEALAPINIGACSTNLLYSVTKRRYSGSFSMSQCSSETSPPGIAFAPIPPVDGATNTLIGAAAVVAGAMPPSPAIVVIKDSIAGVSVFAVGVLAVRVQTSSGLRFHSTNWILLRSLIRICLGSASGSMLFGAFCR